MIINDEWKIESDDLNVILMRKKSKTHRLSNPDMDNNSWECFYYGTVAYALQSLLQKEILGTGMKDFQTISDKIDKINQDIKIALGNLRKI